MIDIAPLEKAIAALQEALRVYECNPLNEGDTEKTVLRDGVIQRFEFTFELAWKTLKRFIESYGSFGKAPLSIKDLFRTGMQEGLLEDAEIWFGYLAMRNQTSHVYKEEQAIEVFKSAVTFLEDAKNLLNNLKSQIG